MSNASTTAALCATCSQTISPKATDIFATPCCARPICPSCVTANPRLVRYNPCLACLGGIGVVARAAAIQQASNSNIDGAVRDEDTFAIGDDEEDDEEAGSPAPPAAEPVAQTTPLAPATSQPANYYIKPSDTLQGIAFRFGVEGRELCRLNKLPPSTLSTTPHLLHTRVSITLPPSAYVKLQETDANSAEEHAREVRRARERAGKRLQTLTKEADWRVAKAYVALADDPDAIDAFVLKRKELGTPSALALGASKLEAAAADQYLDDLEWEAEQLRAGGSVHIPSYPIRQEKAERSTEKASPSWW